MDNPDWNEIEFNPRRGDRLTNQRRAYESAEMEEQNAGITSCD